MKKKYYLMIYYENDLIFILNEHEFNENKNISISNHFFSTEIRNIIGFGKLKSRNLQFTFNQTYNENK